MIKKITYSLARKNTTYEYIDFEIICSDVDVISFSFFFKNRLEEKWRDDAILSTSYSKINKNIISNYVVQDNVINFRWYYSQNKIEYNEKVDIEIRPEPYFKLYAFQDEKTSVIDFDAFGINNITIEYDKRFSDNLYLKNNSLYYNDILIISSLSNPKSIDILTNNGSVSFLICDYGNSRIIEVDENGSIINSYTYSNLTPGFCSYNNLTGNICFIDSYINNVIEIYWKNVITDLPSANLGTTIWDYNSEYPSNPLTSPSSCSYGYLNNIVISDTEIVRVNRDITSLSLYDSFYFEKIIGEVNDNKYTPQYLWNSYEYDKNKFIFIENTSDLLQYNSSELFHKTFNRSLKDDSNIINHLCFENSIYYPIQYNLSNNYDLTIKVQNLNKLKNNSLNVYNDAGREIKILDNQEYDKRGDIDRDKCLWGIDECFIRGSGAQPLLCMTGQNITVNIPFDKEKIGYYFNEKVNQVFVKEYITISFRNMDTGDLEVIKDSIYFNEDINFEINIPEATQASYTKSITNGFNGSYVLEMTVNEYYYSNNNYDVLIKNQEFNYYYPIISLWWKQILKEINITGTPITNFGFELTNFSEGLSYFFDQYTVYPTFYKTVGNRTLSITDNQKKKILYDNCFALISYAIGFVSGDSAFSNQFGFGPFLFNKEYYKLSNNLFKNYSINSSVNNGLSGLNCDYKYTNIFPDCPSETILSNQFIKDVVPIGIINGLYFSDEYFCNGMQTICNFGEIISSEIFVFNERLRLNFNIDDQGLTINNIDVSGKYLNDSNIRSGDDYLKVSFSSSDTISSSIFGISVDDSKYSTFKDESGILRECIFESPSIINDNSIINAYIELIDINDNHYTYTCTKKCINSENFKTTSCDGVVFEFDKIGKLLEISYNLNVRYSFAPYNMSVFLSIEGEETDITSYCVGDVGIVYKGQSKKIILNYNELFIALALTDELKKTEMTIKLLLSGIVDQDFSFIKNYNLFFYNNNDMIVSVEENIAIFNAKENKFSKPLNSIDKVYNLNPSYQGQLDLSRVNSYYLVSSSSSSCSSNSSSNVLISSSSLSSQVSTSTSCSSSSSFVWGHIVQNAGTKIVNGVYYMSGKENGRYKFKKTTDDFYIIYFPDQDYVWAIVDNDDKIFYANVQDFEEPPQFAWLKGLISLNPPPLVQRTNGI